VARAGVVAFANSVAVRYAGIPAATQVNYFTRSVQAPYSLVTPKQRTHI